MRQFNVKMLTREALEETYKITLNHKMGYESNLEKLRGELAVAICAIDDGTVKTVKDLQTGLKNLFLYTDIALNPKAQEPEKGLEDKILKFGGKECKRKNSATKS